MMISSWSAEMRGSRRTDMYKRRGKGKARGDVVDGTRADIATAATHLLRARSKRTRRAAADRQLLPSRMCRGRRTSTSLVVQIKAEQLPRKTDPDNADESCGERSVSDPHHPRLAQPGHAPQTPDSYRGRRDGE